MNLVDIVKVWYAGFQRMFSGPVGDAERVDAARQASARVKSLKSSDENSVAFASVNDAHESKSAIERVRDYEKLPPPTSRKEITHHRLEALSAKLSEKNA